MISVKCFAWKNEEQDVVHDCSSEFVEKLTVMLEWRLKIKIYSS